MRARAAGLWVLSRLGAVTPERAVAWLPWSAALAATASLAVIALHVAFQRRTDLSQMTLSWSLAALMPALVLAFAPAPPVTLAERIDRRGFTAWMLALNAGILLLVLPAGLAVWQTDWDTMTGWRIYPFFNKRWLAALYAVSLLTALVLPIWIDRLLRKAHGESHPAEACAVARRRTPWWRLALECAALLLAVWYLAGPPWNIGTHHRGIDNHEQVHLGPLQAISKGFVPYVGPASTQYGPGFQAAVYAYMTLSGQFNLVGFREAFLAIHLLSFAIVAGLARAHAGARSAWLVLLLGIICSPLKLFLFMADGSPGESYGWGNAARYLGALMVVPAVALLATRSVPRHRALTVALGVVWGVLAWGAQESLASVVTGGGMLLVLLVGTCSATWRQAASTLAALAAGFAGVWVPVLGWYASQGLALAFVDNYFLVPRAVAAGFQNTWWADGANDPLARAFHYTPAIIVVLGVLTLWDTRSWRVRRPLSPEQVRLLSFLCVLAACYQTALYRSDSLHVLNVLMALPFVLVLALRDLPAWTAGTWLGRAGCRVAMATVALTVFPLTPQLTGLYDWVLYPPMYKHQAPVPAQAGVSAGEESIGFERATPGLVDEPSVAGEGTGPMRKFLQDATELRRLIGNRPTFVHSAAPYYTGLVYFMSDLTPAPYLYDVETMLINDRLQTHAWSHFQERIKEVECVIVSSTDAFEARMFLAANPTATVIPRTLGTASLLVIMAGPADHP